MRCQAEGHRGRRELSSQHSRLIGRDGWTTVVHCAARKLLVRRTKGIVRQMYREVALRLRKGHPHLRAADLTTTAEGPTLGGTAGGSPSPHITGRDFRQLVHNYAQGRATLKDASSVWLLVGRGYGRVRGLVSRSVQKERMSE